MEEKIKIILDTDMDTDCDDAGALAMLLEAHRSHRAELLGVIADSINPFAAPACDRIAQYYGVRVPVGTTFAHYDCEDEQPDDERFADYIRHSQTCLAANKSYNFAFTKEIDKKDGDYPSAVSVYRSLLAQAEDHSVTVLCVGMLTAAAWALASGPDAISPLSGVELFQKKVKQIVTMGDPQVSGDFNWGMDAYGAQAFFSLCPSPVYVSAEGTKVLTGSRLSSELPPEHPLRRAYEIFLGGANLSRPSWDLIAALYALQPDTPYLCCKDMGCGSYDAAAKRFRWGNGGVPIKQILLNCEAGELAQYLDGAMLGRF